MAEYTTNYDLVKPAQEDFYNVDDQNRNMDKIDAALKAHDLLHPARRAVLAVRPDVP